MFEYERLRSRQLRIAESKQLLEIIDTLTDHSMRDLTAAADLLDKWGLVPETPTYRNFHMMPTLLGQDQAYVLSLSSGPAASRL